MSPFKTWNKDFRRYLYDGVQIWIHFTLGLCLEQRQRELWDLGRLGLIQDEWRRGSRGLPSGIRFTGILHVNATATSINIKHELG